MIIHHIVNIFVHTMLLANFIYTFIYTPHSGRENQAWKRNNEWFRRNFETKHTHEMEKRSVYGGIIDLLWFSLKNFPCTPKNLTQKIKHKHNWTWQCCRCFWHCVTFFPSLFPLIQARSLFISFCLSPQKARLKGKGR